MRINQKSKVSSKRFGWNWRLQRTKSFFLFYFIWKWFQFQRFQCFNRWFINGRCCWQTCPRIISLFLDGVGYGRAFCKALFSQPIIKSYKISQKPLRMFTSMKSSFFVSPTYLTIIMKAWCKDWVKKNRTVQEIECKYVKNSQFLPNQYETLLK